MLGLLYSQVGYEPGNPVRVVVRRGEDELLPDGALCRIRFDDGRVIEAEARGWGTLWGASWWVAEFPSSGVGAGAGVVELVGGGGVLASGWGMRMAPGVLWDRTVEPMAADMLESRARLARAEHGWQDAGALWQESNAHSAMVIGLTDLLEFAPGRLGADLRGRIEAQVVNGCLYLADSQAEAARRGHPDGSVSHDLLGHEDVVLPNDALKAVVAWRRAARLLGPEHDGMRRTFADAADRSWRWVTAGARPAGDTGFCHRQRGLPGDTVIPGDEWMTRDLVMRLWGAVEAMLLGAGDALAVAVETAREIAGRQITGESAEAGWFGHFREFGSLAHSEKAWSHSIFGGNFGADMGGTFPNYLVPLRRLLRLCPGHADAPVWRRVLEDFARGFLIPACRANPFHLVPYGICGDDGPIWFAGPWHGFSCVYGWTAALALELADELDEPELRRIAHANLQWVAGLNAGVTAEAVKAGCHLWRADIAPDEALPHSLIHGVGNRSAGTWLATRGVICNGFATGDQFVFDTDPTRAQDGPHSLTDEDWIPHSAAWLSAIARLFGGEARP